MAQVVLQQVPSCTTVMHIHKCRCVYCHPGQIHHASAPAPHRCDSAELVIYINKPF